MSQSLPELTDAPAPYTFERLTEVAQEVELSKEQATALQIVQLQTAVADQREQLEHARRWAKIWKHAAHINRAVVKDLGQRLREVEK
jgi:hypothetical protein